MTVEELRLREVHQGLPLPVTAARDTATARMEKNRVFQWSMTTPFLQGGYGIADHIPLLGETQEL